MKKRRKRKRRGSQREEEGEEEKEEEEEEEEKDKEEANAEKRPRAFDGAAEMWPRPAGSRESRGRVMKGRTNLLPAAVAAAAGEGPLATAIAAVATVLAPE